MDSDEELVEVPTYRGIPATMILINLLEESNVVELALDAICRFYRQCLRSGSAQILGVYLYGVDDKNTAQSLIESPGVKEIIPLSLPALLEFKKLKNFDIHSCIKAKELKLSDVLWHCSKTFANCKKQISSYKVILLTQLKTTPIVADQTPTLKRVRDLTDSNVDLVMLNIAQTDYNIDLFYINFLKEAYKGQDPVLPEPIFDSIEIEKVMYKESHRRVAVSNLSFEIAEGFSISVGVYSLVKKAGYNHHRKINLDRESNAVVTNVTKMTKVTTESEDILSSSKELPLLNSELLFSQEYGGEHVEFSTDEMKSMKNPFGPPMLRLLGFKPVSIICKEKWFLKIGYFLYPSEKNIEGSTVAFNAMHKACSDLDMVAICVLCTRVNARPTIVALNPCRNPNGLDVAIGFDVVHVPFVENIRDLNIEDEDDSSIEPAHKIVMKDLLSSIQFDYKPDMFANPKLQSEYRAIEAIALEEEEIEPFVDTTKPNSIFFKNVKEDLFEEMFGPFGELAIKRTASKSASEGSKKSKLDIDLGLFQDRLSKNHIEKYTVSQLKEILQSNNIDGLPALTGLKKAELVNLVYNHCK